jgi:hypothetical protein
MAADIPPIDPAADVAAMMAERGIADRILWQRVWLSDIAQGRVAIPLGNPQHLRTLALALGCQPYYLTRLVHEWRAFHGEDVESAPAVAPTKVCDGCSAARPIAVYAKGDRICNACRAEKRQRKAALTEKVKAELEAKAAARVAAREEAIVAATLPTKVCWSCGETKLKTEYYGRYDRSCKKCRLNKAKQNRNGVGMPDPELSPQRKPGRPRKATASAVVKWWK